MAVNWTKLRTEYVNGHISYAKLAEKYDVPLNTIKEKGTKEKWVEKKKKQHAIIQQKTNQKTAEKIAEKESDLAANINKAANELLNKLNIAIAQTDLYIERTKTRVPKKVRDKKTGEEYTAWQEEESIRLSQKDGINVSSLKQLTSALKDLQSIQLGTKSEGEVESPNINIMISAATPEDMEVDED